MGLDVWDAIVNGPIGSFEAKKNSTKQLIWQYERIVWKSTCILYGNLSIYQNVLNDIKPLAWWKFVRKKPIKMKQVSCVVAILLGTQPKGMQCNFSGHCRLCEERQHDSPEHMLMRCPRMSEQRLTYVSRIKANMPTAMADCFERMGTSEIYQFLLSGLHNTYEEEWISVYSIIADYIWEIYKYRAEFYNVDEHSNSLP